MLGKSIFNYWQKLIIKFVVKIFDLIVLIKKLSRILKLRLNAMKISFQSFKKNKDTEYLGAL